MQTLVDLSCSLLISSYCGPSTELCNFAALLFSLSHQTPLQFRELKNQPVSSESKTQT